MRWVHPIGDGSTLRKWLRWRERILIDQEDAAIRAARDEATGELREKIERLLEERE